MKVIIKPRPVDGKDWPKGMQLGEKPVPTVERPTDVIIKVHAGAVCGTDVGIYQSKDSLRKEMLKAKTDPALKKVVKKKTATQLAADKGFLKFLEKKFFATAEMHITCGTCYQCRIGEKHVCRNTVIKGVHDDGAWAEVVKVPAENVRLFFGREIPPEIISFMDALGNATHTVMSAPVQGRDVGWV